MNHCGDRIRAARKERGLTQIELSERLGWRGNARLASYEGGRNTPPLDVIEALAAALECPPGLLAFGEHVQAITLEEWRAHHRLAIPQWLLGQAPPATCRWVRVTAGGGLPGRAAVDDLLVVDTRSRTDGAVHAVRLAGSCLAARVLTQEDTRWWFARTDGHPVHLRGSQIAGKVIGLLRTV